ncbi:acetamidase/formamidase family protein [Streptacidiphilus sp. EB103A]|uniref:acetamidase/formamidase family protein n=1 Tax=Streptacidiphilus sp. EB103A TaxID=3156275 RepID=UPI003512F55C
MHVARTRTHTAWDRTLSPLAELTPGQELVVETAEASGGQLDAGSDPQDLLGLDFGRLNPVTGPFAIASARPGDALVVDILDMSVGGWGWTACIPGFGLLADDFAAPHLRISKITEGSVELIPGLEIPLAPMLGTVGVAPPEPGPHGMIPPRRWGGNMDIRHLGPGARLILPVGVDGALLSLGDAHAAMGDGEVAGTGIETDSTVRIRVDLLRDAAPPTPVVETDARSHRTGRALATTGIGPDLMQASRDAVRALLDQIVARSGLSPEDAYLLASVTADLKISEIVDAPNWVVTAHLPLAVLD